MFKSIAHLMTFARRASRRLRMYLLRPLFGSQGRGFRFDPDGLYSFPNIHVGDEVNLGYQPILMAALSEIRIGSRIMFGPQVMVIGGGHNTAKIGAFMSEVHEKAAGDDLGVVIEDDVWVGGRAIILRGVTLGRGSIIGAGSVVNRSTPLRHCRGEPRAGDPVPLGCRDHPPA
ncbi:MAG: galactoside O-acetyltransferase [Holophagaceae bacterium]|uniref:Galactoside O-acetyltransferase n=1 Tax=Candidatus Geothrix odensensis TaxID=2954440 RepID=A0A936K854_9BACT|nr:galactoside O-acetyltransferase [Candidatus Geothrix odensensis]